MYAFAGRSTERLGVQLHEARESFVTIADRHAEAMMVGLFVNLPKKIAYPFNINIFIQFKSTFQDRQ